MNKHRITKDVVDIDYKQTKDFFANRALKYNDENPYVVTMYQDNHTDLVLARNKREKEIIIPYLNLSKESMVLDVACGIGRWADAIDTNIRGYLGVDFSDELINIANLRNSKENFKFVCGDIKELKQYTTEKYNTFLLFGILMYLNDDDIDRVFKSILDVCDEKAIICIRDPLAENERLTLVDFYSEELNDKYNAIYRTKRELEKIIQKNLFAHGFEITREGYLFSESGLNNRKETSQYFYILERGID